ncbi:MAG: Glu/Leu/Phe/Val dehydrogenase [Candidatus Nealsonbacteria bacterium CG08_land_8_20_14_0_20_38_20]|uniref:Glutamate dehydrogenase n=1 Tax=Candidatus Nealsonbacteria bacterium CG08_land_8_20_14_0_20_38_20 TaxID=1974705 RepID=A0A2H0YL97_9BACT|nr:MAG: Glu/Leu/Phe/Val dehydrogenase [Candidatus Nealsonbacteria bacterium CG08_land_8_20_14_0_20_38_20]
MPGACLRCHLKHLSMREIIFDEFGPEYVLKVYDPKIGMEGFLVIDSTALGPGKGGIRMTANVTTEEVFRLARTMTWKNALAELPFGGAKAGIKWQGGPDGLKKQFIQSFARAIKIFIPQKYIAGPDVNTGEKEMQWFVEATKNWRSATGKPETFCLEIYGKPGQKKCGIPHEFGSTGFGVAQSTKIASEIMGLDIKKATVAIHGFGNVGTFAYRYLTQMGAKIIALVDLSAAIYDKDGFDEKLVERQIKDKKPLADYPKGKRIRAQDFWGLPVDILIPASVTDVINEKNKNKIKAKIIVEAGNIPMSEKIEKELFKKGIIIVPDFLANAGGVISSYSEYRGYHPAKMFETVEKKIKKNAGLVLNEALKEKRNPREVALEIAKKRVREAMEKNN